MTNNRLEDALFAVVQLLAATRAATPTSQEIVATALRLAVTTCRHRERRQSHLERQTFGPGRTKSWHFVTRPNESEPSGTDGHFNDVEAVQVSRDDAADLILTAFRSALHPRGANRAWEMLTRRALGETDAKIAATTFAEDGSATLRSKSAVAMAARRAIGGICKKYRDDIDRAIARWHTAPMSCAPAL